MSLPLVYVLSVGVRDAEEIVGVFTSFDLAVEAARRTEYWDDEHPPRMGYLYGSPLRPADQSCGYGGIGGDQIIVLAFSLDHEAQRDSL